MRAATPAKRHRKLTLAPVERMRRNTPPHTPHANVMLARFRLLFASILSLLRIICQFGTTLISRPRSLEILQENESLLREEFFFSTQALATAGLDPVS
jgi:hypothetical protein